VISELSSKKEHLVFILWGNHAKSKLPLIDGKKHLVLTSAHPSPFSAHLFFNNQHFILTNDYLSAHGLPTIDWKTSEVKQ
jgi:uracil-DNA glycosylase